jgi:hypothetical protein
VTQAFAELGKEEKGVESHSGGPVRDAGSLGTLIALAAAVVFALAATRAGPVARYGGAVWVFILTWVVLMPVLAPRRKKQHQP